MVGSLLFKIQFFYKTLYIYYFLFVNCLIYKKINVKQMCKNAVLGNNKNTLYFNKYYF
jgi:hypothetical protein